MKSFEFVLKNERIVIKAISWHIAFDKFDILRPNCDVLYIYEGYKQIYNYKNCQ